MRFLPCNLCLGQVNQKKFAMLVTDSGFWSISVAATVLGWVDLSEDQDGPSPRFILNSLKEPYYIEKAKHSLSLSDCVMLSTVQLTCPLLTTRAGFHCTTLYNSIAVPHDENGSLDIVGKNVDCPTFIVPDCMVMLGWSEIISVTISTLISQVQVIRAKLEQHAIFKIISTNNYLNCPSIMMIIWTKW